MCEELILTRDSPNDPWGFRLTGGKNFGTPLTVVKVTGGGIAESAGIQVGDMVMGINNEDTADFSHSVAQKAILNAGDHLILQVLRGSPVEPPVTPLRGMTPVSRPQSTITVTLDHVENLLDANIVPSDADVVLVRNSEANLNAPVDQPYPESKKTNEEPSEDDIAQLMLENAEVIDDYHVIGVNFQRFVPKCDFIKNSLVFQALQDEAIRKEKSEEEILQKCPDKRFSTFLVQPNRPKPVIKILLKDDKKTKPNDKEKKESKKELEEQGGENEVKLESTAKSENEIEAGADATAVADTAAEADADNLPTAALNTEEEKISNKDSTQVTEELVTALENIIDGNVKEEEETDNAEEKENQSAIAEKQSQLNNVSSELSEFDKQLAQIQNELASISILPFEIQSHLNQVQEQINKLLELKNNIVKSKTEKNTENQLNEENDGKEVKESEGEETENKLDETEPVDWSDLGQSTEEHNSQNQPYENGTEQYTEEDRTYEQEEEPVRRRKWSIPREKPSFPLTPLLRPMVLPGGRKWKSPKDAYSEAFITETLVSQAEVLVGTTIGVNFRKYEPAKIDMSHSPVWRLIHNVEEPRGGIASRPEKIAADCEYMEPVTSSLTEQHQPSNEPGA